MAGQMSRSGFEGAAFAVVDADARSLASVDIAEKFHLETAKLRGWARAAIRNADARRRRNTRRS